MRIVKLFSVLALAALAACAGTDDLGPGKTGKSFTVSGPSYDQVWNAALASVKEQTGDQSLEVEKNLSVSKEDKATGSIVATTGMSVLSWGEVVGVYINPPHDAPSYRIDVESRTKLQTNFFANNWEDEIIAGIKTKLPGATY
jgi:hypothetical protein